MIGFGFLNSKGKCVAITEPNHRLDNIPYFAFRVNINPHLVDKREPDSVHLFVFSLRFPNIFPSSSESHPFRNSIQTNTTPALVRAFDSTLSKLSDDDL